MDLYFGVTSTDTRYMYAVMGNIRV